MPAIYINNFGFTNQVSPAWRWENTDDAGLSAFMEEHSSDEQGDFSVDRSGTDVLLTWQKYEYVGGGNYGPTGVYDNIAIADGDYLHPKVYSPVYGEPATPQVFDMTGWWESDQYGRPFDLNDLLA